MKKSAVTAGILAGMAVAGTVGMVIGGKAKTRRAIRKTVNAMEGLESRIQQTLQKKG